MRHVLLAIFAMITASCGEPEYRDYRDDSAPTEAPCNESCQNNKKIDELQKTILQLAGTQAQLNALVMSDFATCPAAGDTSDPLINKICKVAQASTVEARVEMKGELATYVAMLKTQIDNVNKEVLIAEAQEASDVVAINAQITSITTQLSTITTSITSLGTRMTTAESAITALQTATASINATLSGTMVAVDIGTENSASGPLYETVLRRADGTRINAYVEVLGAATALGNNPLSASNGSNVLTVTMTGHALTAGDTVYLAGFTGGRGFSTADVNGYFTVSTVLTANTFTINASRNATSSGSLGGAAATAAKFQGRGLANVWKSADGADVAVRQTTLGTQKYNFIVKANGDVCYDKTNAAASFATINANGSNIVCK